MQQFWFFFVLATWWSWILESSSRGITLVLEPYDVRVTNSKCSKFLQEKATINATFRIWFYCFVFFIAVQDFTLSIPIIKRPKPSRRTRFNLLSMLDLCWQEEEWRNHIQSNRQRQRYSRYEALYAISFQEMPPRWKYRLE